MAAVKIELVAVDWVDVPLVGENSQTGEKNYVHVPIATLVRTCVQEQMQIFGASFQQRLDSASNNNALLRSPPPEATPTESDRVRPSPTKSDRVRPSPTGSDRLIEPLIRL